MDYVPQGGNWKSIPDFQGKNMHSDRYYRLHPDKPSPTIVNWRKLPLIHPFENRTLTVAEAAALMGLDKHYKILGTLGEKQQQVGNGVPISIGKFIKKLVKKAFARNEGFSPVYV